MLLAIREPFTRNRKEDLLQDVERGEQALKVQFRHCLSAQPLSPESRDCVSNALNCVLSEPNRRTDGWSSQNVITSPSPLPPTLTGSFEALI